MDPDIRLYTGEKMASSLRFGGGLRLARDKEDGDFDRNKANATAVDLEEGNDKSSYESPEFNSSPEQFSSRTTPPRRRGRKTGKGSKPMITTPIHYDYIAHTETLADDLRLFLRKVGVTNRDDILPQTKKRGAEKKLRNLFALIPLEDLRRVARKFKADFEMFGYSYEEEVLKLSQP
uniref:Carbohydrate sulfotransferase n=1 Tax=Branchiostoma floridae TaxID=7739 RepID=C3ZQL0_BRAFL|eukprot:XP_002589255.1 hypothetical protein BRAFLDRAFT_74588 [Branchiostoma floridae]